MSVNVRRLLAPIAIAGSACMVLAGIAAAPAALADEQAAEEVAADSTEVTESQVPMVAAEIEEAYTEAPAAPEAVGDEQQSGAVSTEVVPEDAVPSAIARVDFNSDIAVLGVTWDPGALSPAEVSYRTLEDEVWTEWATLEQAPPPEWAETVARAGTDPVTLTNVTAVEVVARSADGNEIPGIAVSVIDPRAADEVENALDVPQSADEEPQSSETEEDIEEDIEAPIEQEEMAPEIGEEPATEEPIDGQSGSEDGSEDTTTDQTPDPQTSDSLSDLEGAADATSALLSATGEEIVFVSTALNSAGTQFNTGKNGLIINTRKAWGADESKMKYGYEGVTYRGAVIHHTAGSNNYTQAQVAGQIRGIYNYHAVTLGWGDIGYQLLVDKYGGVWEGRSGGLTRSNIGAQAYGANRDTFGISVLGDYSYSAPPQVAQDAVAKAIAWKLQLHGINNIDGTIRVPGSDNRGRNIAVVSGHRDVGGTACPGQAFYNRLPQIRNQVKNFMKGTTSQGSFKMGVRSEIGHGWYSPVVYPGDWNGDGVADMMLVDSAGKLWLYAGSGRGGFYPRVQIGHGWQVMDWIGGGVDWDGDGNNDIVARTKTGELRLYPGNGRGAFKASRKIGVDWQGFSSLALTRTAAGPAIYGILGDRFYVYPGNGKGGFKTRQVLGPGWSVMDTIAAVGDWTGDGRPDIVARSKTGYLRLYYGTASGTISGAANIGDSWQTMSYIGVSDQSKPKAPLWPVGTNGKLWNYPVY